MSALIQTNQLSCSCHFLSSRLIGRKMTILMEAAECLRLGLMRHLLGLREHSSASSAFEARFNMVTYMAELQRFLVPVRRSATPTRCRRARACSALGRV